MPSYRFNCRTQTHESLQKSDFLHFYDYNQRSQLAPFITFAFSDMVLLFIPIAHETNTSVFYSSSINYMIILHTYLKEKIMLTTIFHLEIFISF